jgi:hypothetical protein
MTVQQVSHLFFQLCAFSTVVCDSGVTERSWCWPTSGGELSDLGVGENTREFCVWAEGVRHPGRVSDTLGGCPTPGCRTPSVSGPRSRLLEGGGCGTILGYGSNVRACIFCIPTHRARYGGAGAKSRCRGCPARGAAASVGGRAAWRARCRGAGRQARRRACCRQPRARCGSLRPGARCEVARRVATAARRRARSAAFARPPAPSARRPAGLRRPRLRSRRPTGVRAYKHVGGRAASGGGGRRRQFRS